MSVRKLNTQPYIVLLLIYWTCLYLRFIQRRTQNILLIAAATICLMAIAVCPMWALLLTVPALWLMRK